MSAQGDFFPLRANLHVESMQYAADVRYGGIGTIIIPACIAADDNIVGDNLDADAAIGTELLTTAYEVDAKFGRNITMTASGATGASANYRVRGKDYLGQPMYEDIEITNAEGTTQQVGKKAFKYVSSIKPTITAVNAVTVDCGVGNVLGLPYKTLAILNALVSDVVPTAGTFVDGLTTGTAQTGLTDDPRGTYTPHASFVPDASRKYKLSCVVDVENLHGDAQSYV